MYKPPMFYWVQNIRVLINVSYEIVWDDYTLTLVKKLHMSSYLVPYEYPTLRSTGKSTRLL